MARREYRPNAGEAGNGGKIGCFEIHGLSSRRSCLLTFGNNMIQEQEKPLCISCLHPNAEEAHFCEKCGAPLDSYASTAPFEQIFAQGHAFRAATEGRPRLIVVIGIWLIFLPGVLSAIILGPLSVKHSGSWLGAIVFTLFGILSAALIVLSTRRYIASRTTTK